MRPSLPLNILSGVFPAGSRPIVEPRGPLRVTHPVFWGLPPGASDVPVARKSDRATPIAHQPITAAQQWQPEGDEPTRVAGRAPARVAVRSPRRAARAERAFAPVIARLAASALALLLGACRDGVSGPTSRPGPAYEVVAGPGQGLIVVCKQGATGGVTGPFVFDVTGAADLASSPVTVTAAGTTTVCAPAVVVAAGSQTVTERARAGFEVAGVTFVPAGSGTRSGNVANVTVPDGGSVRVTFLNQVAKTKSGNNANAKLCQKGGYVNLVTSTGAAFASEAECVSYAAGGGVLAAARPTLVATAYAAEPGTTTYGWALEIVYTGLLDGSTISVYGTYQGTTNQVIGTGGGGPYGSITFFRSCPSGMSNWDLYAVGTASSGATIESNHVQPPC